jgi:hypothetical protein
LATLVRERDRPEVGGEEAVAESATSGRRRVPLAAHATVLALALLLGAPMLHLQTAWVGDEGAYAMQVRALQDGRWEYDYVGRDFDPKGSWFPLATGEGFNYRFGGRFYSYVKHPTYVVLQRISVGAFGDGIGFHVPAMAGAVLCAIAAWLLAGEVAGRAERWAFWLTATAPVLFNAYVMWAHALSAGVAGLTLVAGLRLAKGRWSWVGLAALGAGIVLGTLLRSESVLFGLAMAAPLALLAWRTCGLVRGALVGAVAGVGALLGRFVGGRLVNLVVMGAYGSDSIREGNQPEPYWPGRISGARHVLWQGSEATPHASELLQQAALLALAAAIVLRVRRWPAALAASGLLFAAAVVVAVRFHDHPFESSTGLFVTWPVLIVGLLVHRFGGWTRAATAVAAILLLFLAGVLLTQYPIGGGLEWGGRFLSPATAPLAALAAVGLHDVVRAHWARSRLVAGVLVASLAAVAIVPIGSGLRLLEKYRTDKQGFYDELAARSSPVIVVGIPALVELPRGAWRMDDRFDWLMAPNGDATQVIEKLRAAGHRDVTLLDERVDPTRGPLAYPVVRDVTGPRAANAQWVLLRLQEA